MDVVILIGITIVLLGMAFFGMAIKILFSKERKFPDTHISHNKEMRKLGIHCVKTMDRREQLLDMKKTKFRGLKLTE